jgi:hypothetical protein
MSSDGQAPDWFRRCSGAVAPVAAATTPRRPCRGSGHSRTVFIGSGASASLIPVRVGHPE